MSISHLVLTSLGELLPGEHDEDDDEGGDGGDEDEEESVEEYMQEQRNKLDKEKEAILNNTSLIAGVCLF